MPPPRANRGDRLLVPDLGNAAEQGVRVAVVIEVIGEAGAAPYLVEWDDGSRTVIYPSHTTQVLPPADDG